MARRNIFQPPAPPTDEATGPQEAKPRFPNTGAMSGVKSTLRDLSSNAVREIDPEMIDDGGPRDRMAFTDSDVADLAESLRRHGQQVPLMVRPLAERPGYYRIVYGRRRLRALRSLGMPAKALVRTLSDAEAILAQGQENAQRLDPSFIEKALFAAELVGSGYETPVVLDALAIDKPMLSRMTKVAREIPDEVIRAIGAAHGVGRRRWEDLAERAQPDRAGLSRRVDAMSADLASLPSDARFDRVMQTARTGGGSRTSRSPALPLRDADGAEIGEIRETTRALTIKLNRSSDTGFADWLRDNAQAELLRLHADWIARHRPD